ncbi:MAG: hypothetical protein E7261_05220 [Lachnospiraceae bacterium]|nr:hypothetical protein [Lachnospiraceae bacterium]
MDEEWDFVKEITKQLISEFFSLRDIRHADRLASKLARCRGIRRIVQRLNMLLRVQAPDEQYLNTVQHGSKLRAFIFPKPLSKSPIRPKYKTVTQRIADYLLARTLKGRCGRYDY